MPQFDTIPEEEHANVLSAFWVMLREDEEQAHESKSAMARYFVEGHYQLWNRITGSDLKPRWKNG